MATTTRRRLPGSVPVPQSAIEQATVLLQDLPEKPKEQWSLREAIDILKDPISSALERGYTHEEIAVMLAERNINISVSSLKRYLASTRASSAGRTRKPRRTNAKKATAETTEPVSTPPDVETPAEDVTPKRRGRRPNAAKAAAAEVTKTAAKSKPRSTSRARTAPTKTSTRGRRKASS